MDNSKISTMYVTEEDMRKNIREMRSDLNIVVKDFTAVIKELNTKINNLQETLSLQAEMIKELTPK